MNLPLFLKKVDSLTKDMSDEELGIFVHETARLLPEEKRGSFLERLRAAASVTESDGGYAGLDTAGKNKLIDEIHHIEDLLSSIDEGELCLTSEINEEYDDWYNSDAEEFLFEDHEGVLGTIDTAMDLIHRCVDMELYEEGYTLAELLATISVQDEGEYDVCIGQLLDVHELYIHNLLTCDFDRLCRDSLYLAYKGNQMEDRADDIYRMMSNLNCRHLSLEDMLQNGQEELEHFEEFLDTWIEYLVSLQGREEKRLIQEAQSLMNDEEKEVENAKKYAGQYPSLYEQYLTKHQSADDAQRFFEIGQKAMAEVPVDCRERSQIALLTAGHALRLQKTDEAEMCWVEAFRSEKRPVHFLRIFIESRDYARYEKAVQEICTSMNKRDNADYYTILFLNGRFREVLEDGMNAREALGWSYTFMKKGLRLFLLYLYRGDELPAGLRRMRDGAAGDMTFSEENYCQGLECRQERKDSDLFWKCFCEWKARTVMPEDEQQKVMERLESLIEMRVDGIMGANRRKYYGECAAFIAACGEVKESWGERMGKQSFMDSHRQRYPRRSAFKQELQDLGYRG